MSSPRQLDGQVWEKLALRYLRRNGLTLLTQNYHCRHGELDLVMDDGSVLVFVEVRYRAQAAYGTGADSVGWQKQQRLALAAQHYLTYHAHLSERCCRFDVVAMSGSRWRPRYNWIRNAFDDPL